MSVPRLLLAAACSVAFNAAVVIALSRATPQVGGDEAPATIALVIAEPPPEMTEPATAPSNAEKSEADIIPALQLASLSADAQAMRLPAPHWDLPSLSTSLAMPAYRADVAGGEATAKSDMLLSFDSGPELITPIDLARFYPPFARKRSIGGQSIVTMTVSEQGRVSRVRVISSTPEGVFDDAAERLCSGLRFRPAMRQGKAREQSHSLKIVWEPPP